MHDYKTKLISEFSRLWELDQEHPGNYECQVIPQLKHLMEQLIDEALVRQEFHDDAWARCFLLRTLKDKQPNLKNAVGAARNQEAVWIIQHLDMRSTAELKARTHKPDTNFALLSAYLQKSAWYAAYKLCLKLGLSDSPESRQKSFTAAQQASHVPAKLLQAYDFTYQIRTYAERSLFLKARDGLVKGDPEAKLRKRSPHGRLKGISKEKFEEVLRLGGRSDQQILSDRLLWSCYDEIYQPAKPNSPGIRWTEPTAEQWQAIAHLFNQRQSKQLSPESRIASIDASLAQALLMDTYLKAINDYLESSPSPTPPLSLSALLHPTDGEHSSELEELQVATTITPDQFVEQTDIRDTIAQAFYTLPEPKQAALILMEIGFTTTEAAVQCGVSQSNVSRIVSQPLTQSLIKLLYEQYRNHPDLPDREQLNQRLKAFDLSENAALHCQGVIDQVLTNHWHRQNLVNQSLDDQIASLTIALKQWLTQELHVKQLDAGSTVEPKITTFVESWLRRTY
ncbi:MAG: hypothetical protein KME16_00680 [Scytolyngbya sp. HA4215-MV1]|nr:hypothetical protein [Scytolyngbya sp. HA4215-MV1]